MFQVGLGGVLQFCFQKLVVGIEFSMRKQITAQQGGLSLSPVIQTEIHLYLRNS